MVAVCFAPTLLSTGSSRLAAGRVPGRKAALVVRASSADVEAKKAEAKPEVAAAAAAAPAAPAAKPAASFQYASTGKLIRPHKIAPEPQWADVLDVMSFNGTGPELINGRLAMLGFVAAVGCELFTGQTVWNQVGPGWQPIFLTSHLFIAASLAPLFRNVANDEAFGPFTPEAERLNGRLAMIGFGSIVLFEAFKHQALF